MMSDLIEQGFTVTRSGVSPAILDALAESAFDPSKAGERCLLDHAGVKQVALFLKAGLQKSGYVNSQAVAIQAIAFDKTAATNWKVSWHQDLMFPFFNRISTPDFSLPSTKDGVHYARPPSSVLSQLLAVRLHLDDCDEANGPLRVSPGTHDSGIISTAEVQATVEKHGQVSCLVKKGDLLLMRPLLLHSSSQANQPKHRRVIHLVYYSGGPISEQWHRAV